MPHDFCDFRRLQPGQGVGTTWARLSRTPRRDGRDAVGVTLASRHHSWERDAAMLDFFSNTWVMVGMAVVLLSLIGLLIFLRTRPQE